MFKLVRLMAMIPVLLAAVACSSMNPSTSASASGSSRPELEQKARAAYKTLVETTPKAAELGTHATAVLIFPDILKAGFLVGAKEGDGVMFGPDGKVMGYYNATALSYGLQAGAQTFHQAMFLMTPAALNYLNSSDGWSVGVGPSVVVIDEGKAKSMTTTTLQSDVYAFIYGQEGLMAGAGVQGQKITKIKP
ncbi:YSC84-related protein [Paraburkholderia hospita]|jgi:lipid-binding SYLF domain-containing protein|uniref:lipid-binding SYLF domain-containing protein n=1 Tax=Paraburkholderia hospita TaxID=169430 RepID=UPI000B348113|nr:YSC84-related protein [Paraburkholderia hospita]OUL83492.1 twin-arginine translocation pathway signal protein [Paraburkholderia hospita]